MSYCSDYTQNILINHKQPKPNPLIEIHLRPLRPRLYERILLVRKNLSRKLIIPLNIDRFVKPTLLIIGRYILSNAIIFWVLKRRHENYADTFERGGIFGDVAGRKAGGAGVVEFVVGDRVDVFDEVLEADEPFLLCGVSVIGENTWA